MKAKRMLFAMASVVIGLLSLTFVTFAWFTSSYGGATINSGHNGELMPYTITIARNDGSGLTTVFSSATDGETEDPLSLEAGKSVTFVLSVTLAQEAGYADASQSLSLSFRTLADYYESAAAQATFAYYQANGAIPGFADTYDANGASSSAADAFSLMNLFSQSSARLMFRLNMVSASLTRGTAVVNASTYYDGLTAGVYDHYPFGKDEICLWKISDPEDEFLTGITIAPGETFTLTFSLDYRGSSTDYQEYYDGFLTKHEAALDEAYVAGSVTAAEVRAFFTALTNREIVYVCGFEGSSTFPLNFNVRLTSLASA